MMKLKSFFDEIILVILTFCKQHITLHTLYGPTRYIMYGELRFLCAVVCHTLHAIVWIRGLLSKEFKVDTNHIYTKQITRKLALRSYYKRQVINMYHGYYQYQLLLTVYVLLLQRFC